MRTEENEVKKRETTKEVFLRIDVPREDLGQKENKKQGHLLLVNISSVPVCHICTESLLSGNLKPIFSFLF